jgi:cysteine desulfurase
MSGQKIYLDYAAATPVDPAVTRTMLPYFTDNFYNPSATYKAALDVHKDLEAARTKAAHWLGAQSSEIIFTAGGTEANNLAIHGVMRRFPKANLLVSSVEHESVRLPAGQYGGREIAVSADGRVDMPDLKRKITDKTVLISVMYANNEIGTVQPIREIARLVKEIRADRLGRDLELPLYLHADACQAGNYLDLHVARLGIDLMSVNGGKLYGPKQSGLLYVKSGLSLEPLIFGGGQERGLRGGTENVAADIGFSTALELAQKTRHEESVRLQKLQKQFIEQLQGISPDVFINGSLKQRLPNNIHVTIPGHDNERLLIQLDEDGIMAAAGSACSADSGEPSHVLTAIGLSDDDARASLRFTMGRQTTAAMVEQTVKVLRQLV